MRTRQPPSCLRGDYGYDSASSRPPWDCNATALRPFDDLQRNFDKFVLQQSSNRIRIEFESKSNRSCNDRLNDNMQYETLGYSITVKVWNRYIRRKGLCQIISKPLKADGRTALTYRWNQKWTTNWKWKESTSGETRERVSAVGEDNRDSAFHRIGCNCRDN